MLGTPEPPERRDPFGWDDVVSVACLIAFVGAIVVAARVLFLLFP